MFSCKNDKNTKNESLKIEASKDYDLFKVSFDLIIKKDDNFHLYYTEDGSINFIEKTSIWLPVKGSDKQQTITFVFPKDVIPTHLRVDLGFGKNEDQSDVELKHFLMSYFDKTILVKENDILNYFYPNKLTTTVVNGTCTLKRLSKNQDVGPMLYPQILLTEKIKEITQNVK